MLLCSYYDPYRGVIVYFRVVDGSIRKGDKIYFMASGKVKIECYILRLVQSDCNNLYPFIRIMG